MTRFVLSLQLLALLALETYGQSNPLTYPATKYIVMNGQAGTIEHTAPAPAIVTLAATNEANSGVSASTGTNSPDSSSGSANGPAYPIQGTFLNFYRNLTPQLWRLEFQYMKQININTVVVVSVGHLQADSTDPTGYGLAPDGLLYPSQYVLASQRPATDLLETILSLADQADMNVFLGSLQTATDWTDGTEFTALRTYNQRIAAEVLQKYGFHSSLRGWYFTQEIWMNWVKYYGGGNYNAGAYYGTALVATWASDMKVLDPTRLTTAAVVVKESGDDSMPGLSSSELKSWMTSFLQATDLSIIMPQDGAGAQAGAPPLSDLPAYYAAMQAATQAAGTGTALWSTLETFTSEPNLSSEQYPPADVSRIQQQLTLERPYVTGYVSWIFGDDMSPQATYYPAKASELLRRYLSVMSPQPATNYDL